MEKLLDAVTALVSQISPDKVRALAARIREINDERSIASLSEVVGTPAAKAMIGQIVDSWQTSPVSSGELASMLLASSHTFKSVCSHQTTELVWTGPTTPFVSARRTEQALLQVITAAKKSLYLTSFVAYDISNIVKALNVAIKRGVNISMLLESSQEDGGSISFDAIGKMRGLIPSVHLFSWRERAPSFADGCVHAKVAVADGKVCFITSANLTGYALEQNMEAGVLIIGGPIPQLLIDHLQALIDMRIVSAV